MTAAFCVAVVLNKAFATTDSIVYVIGHVGLEKIFRLIVPYMRRFPR